MKMREVRSRAKLAGVSTSGSKAAIIHRIQAAEGNDSCFATRDQCNQMDCCWREDCIPRQAL